MKKKTMRTVYLDTNILGYVANGSLRFPMDGLSYTYSSEHFNELARGNATFLLDTLTSLLAREISIDLNDRFQVTDHATLSETGDIRARYADHIKTMEAGRQHLETFRALTAMMWGAPNADAALQAVARLPEEILPANLAERHPEIVAEANRVSSQLLAALRPASNHQQPQTKRRKAIGADRVQTSGIAAARIIPEFWKKISPHFPGLAVEQAFWLDPVDKQGYETWPKYLAVIGCHEC